METQKGRNIFFFNFDTEMYGMQGFIEPTCALCTVGSYASLSVCLCEQRTNTLTEWAHDHSQRQVAFFLQLSLSRKKNEYTLIRGQRPWMGSWVNHRGIEIGGG